MTFQGLYEMEQKALRYAVEIKRTYKLEVLARRFGQYMTGTRPEWERRSREGMFRSIRRTGYEAVPHCLNETLGEYRIDLRPLIRPV